MCQKFRFCKISIHKVWESFCKIAVHGPRVDFTKVWVVAKFTSPPAEEFGVTWVAPEAGKYTRISRKDLKLSFVIKKNTWSRILPHRPLVLRRLVYIYFIMAELGKYVDKIIDPDGYTIDDDYSRLSRWSNVSDFYKNF